MASSFRTGLQSTEHVGGFNRLGNFYDCPLIPEISMCPTAIEVSRQVQEYTIHWAVGSNVRQR